jgi:putative phosphoesterase
MLIGIISDTRIPGGASEIPQQVIRSFEGVDLILHAGGIHIPEVLDWLEQIAPVKAVGRIHGGQAERPTPLALESENDPRIAERQVLQLEGHVLGMVNNLQLDRFNDDVLPGVIGSTSFLDRSLPEIVEEFFGNAVDIVVFGRTLYPMVEEHHGVLFINPGSPSLPRNLVRLGNVAILNLTPHARVAKIIDLADVQ